MNTRVCGLRAPLGGLIGDQNFSGFRRKKIVAARGVFFGSEEKKPPVAAVEGLGFGETHRGPSTKDISDLFGEIRKFQELRAMFGGKPSCTRNDHMASGAGQKEESLLNPKLIHVISDRCFGKIEHFCKVISFWRISVILQLKLNDCGENLIAGLHGSSDSFRFA